MTLYALGEERPRIDPTAWVAPGAQVIGRVALMPRASVWFGAVLRGDNEWITLGEGSNLQEGVLCHTDPGFPLTVGPDCTIGHRAVLHGCTVGAGSLIGMGSIVLNGAVIGAGCLIGAGALVTEGKAIPDGSLVMGMPGKVVRALSADEIARIAASAARYRERAAAFARELRALP
jgi:carbonic anhydrase/acetyltransferase-like protein (isoleucine patch superfamily)